MAIKLESKFKKECPLSTSMCVFVGDDGSQRIFVLVVLLEITFYIVCKHYLLIILINVFNYRFDYL